MKAPLKKLGLRIEYIYHSGFTVETDRDFLVFDYYQGQIQFPSNKRIFFFSSHAHPDHYNPEIFHWQTQYPDIHYILSSDIQGHPQLPQIQENLTFLSPYEEVHRDDLKIRTYGSTDVGISFLVELDVKEGIHLFHAGDLNWWHWWGEPQEDILWAEKMFKEEIAKIKEERIDIAFFPVDPRLEQYYSIGAEYFIQEINPQVLVPMHFGEDYKSVQSFVEKMASSSTEILGIPQSNQYFAI
ncbi:MAG TPA: MBL fold metallo-hydrolase [Desulfitobacterium dehalogenans]|uniref:MBL fold metallo-hydrolase n=1 Tax=Desulfitobacterium dehalogenans TaxID=36854 RepID=A0A7C6Z6Y5_9FIRM|nr:MBL fold metallo-hydrolase [Desulfitobacterium dehalogenans]